MKELIKKLKEQGYFDENLGLDASEIEELKDNVDFKIPWFFVKYLKNFGFNENLFWTIFNEEDEFIEQNEFIHGEGDYDDYILIGDEYGENFILAHNKTQQLFLLEDDHLIDLKMTFDEMLSEIVETLQSTDYETNNKVDAIYQSVLKQKQEISEAVKTALDQVINVVTNDKDQLYSLIISHGNDHIYQISGGSFEDFKTKIDSDTIDYEALFNSESLKYQEKIDLNFLKLDSNLMTKKALDLVCLEVLRDLKNKHYFDNQIENISISVTSTDANLFPEDSYDDALTKRKSLATTIRRFWESPYDRTRLILENL
ncbi:hypothetical protein [Empedobacter sedimenti]|uniref:hypothetical protein n=1 Tax=Empedobacter sedimenti TaxID=3042610 RepID=UPI0024A6FCEF|nr:hypothetical protein [Empedobacter sedimenti]